MSFEVDMDVGGSNLASGNQFATPQDPDVVAAAQPPSIDSIIKSFDKTEARTPRKAEEKASPSLTPSSEKKRGFNRLIDKIFMSPKGSKPTGNKTPMKSPASAPSPSPARDAQGFAVPSPQVRSTPNMIARQASIRHMNHGMSNVGTLSRQASIRGSFVPSSPRNPNMASRLASPLIQGNLARQSSNVSIRLKKQSAWRNTAAITNPMTFASVPAVEAKATDAKVAEEEKASPRVLAIAVPAPAGAASISLATEQKEQEHKEKEVAEKKEQVVAEDKRDEKEKAHKSKEEKEKRRALKKKKVTEKKGAETVAETPERQVAERKSSPTQTQKENGSGIRAKSVMSPTRVLSGSALSPVSNSPSRRALASHNNGSELPWLV